MNFFKQIEVSQPPVSTFDLTHDVKTTFSMGELVPVCVLEALPGDVFTLNAEVLARFMPLIAPMMHRVKLKAEFFFVPNRILWPQWDDFITGKDEVQHPYIDLGSTGVVERGSVLDYLGYPVINLTQSRRVNPFPIAAYLRIWNEYYRHQYLQPELNSELFPGNNEGSSDYVFGEDSGGVWYDTPPLRRLWPHDYFTSALPFPQAGDEVTIPLTEADGLTVYRDANGNPAYFRDFAGNSVPVGNVESTSMGVRAGGDLATYDPNGTLKVDVQQDAASVTKLRFALRLQQFYERTARAGNRLVEFLRAHFGTSPTDERFQRPEFIFSIRGTMTISEVLSTASDLVANIPVGMMAGHGISYTVGKGATFACPEHGWIMGLLSFVPDPSYYNRGIHRSLLRQDRFDYAFPIFGNVGEQGVKRIELDARADPDEVFGYVPRYSEYKFMNNRISGEFSGSLEYWHLARVFENIPSLNEFFVTCNPSSRIFAVTDEEEDHVVAQVLNSVSVRRRLPYFGTPSI